MKIKIRSPTAQAVFFALHNNQKEENKMRERKLLKQMMSLLIVMMMVIQTSTSVFAKRAILDLGTAMSDYISVKEHIDNLGGYHAAQGKRVFKVDGKYAYCIESNIDLSSDKVYEDGYNVQEILASKPNHLTTWKEKYDMISILLLLVPVAVDDDNKAEHIKWLVGQTMVWEVTGEERDTDFKYSGNTREGSTAYRDRYIWKYASDKKTYDDFYKQLEQKVQSFYKIPSFMSASKNQKLITLDQFDGTYYYTKVTDTNKVLQQYDFQGNNLMFEMTDHQMIIKSKTVQNASLIATLKSNYKRRAPLVWCDGKFQRVVTSGDLTNVDFKAYANIEVGEGNLEIIKNDSFEKPIANAIFEITAPSGKTTTHTTNTNGQIVLKALECGQYTIREILAPEGYLLNKSTFKIQVIPMQTTTQVVVDDEPLGRIELTKTIDKSHTNELAGDAYLKDNEYTLYAKEDITNKNKTHIYYKKDQKVASLKTDQQGKIVFSSLHLGKYYLKETQANDSLVMNPQVYDIHLTYQDMETSLITQSILTNNKVNSQKIRIYKQSQQSDTSAPHGLAGAEFTFVLESEYQEKGTKAKKYFVGTTDSQGYLTTPLLPYGIYRVQETKTPEGYYGIEDFFMTIDKDASEYEASHQVKTVTVNNQPYESMLKIVKKDQETGKIVEKAGATFLIKNLKTQDYVTHHGIKQWTSQDDGTITLDFMLECGQYQLEEIDTPQGYLVNHKPLMFTITKEDLAHDQKVPLKVIEFSNQPIQGQIEIQKQGEMCVDYQDGKFVYEKRGIANVKFGIYAYEDILDPADQSVIYKKGELVETVVTKENGQVSSSLLPLGIYECVELETPFGYVKGKSQVVKICEQKKAIVVEHLDIFNQRQKMKVEVSKKDEESLAYLDGAIFSLIANRDIYNVDGKVIVEAGTIIEEMTSSNAGQVTFESDLPIDLSPVQYEIPLYVVKETKVPDGYVSKNVTFDIGGQYTNDLEQIVCYSYDFYNTKTQLLVHKVDESMHNLLGARLQVIDQATNTIIDEWTSYDEAHVIEGLIVGKTYVLHEVEAASGYMLADDITFTIQDTAELQNIMMIDKKIPDTSDSTNLSVYLFIAVGCIAIVLLMKKRED